MTWRDAFVVWANDAMGEDHQCMIQFETDAFRAGAKWAAGDLIDNAVWESRDIVYEFQKRLEEE